MNPLNHPNNQDPATLLRLPITLCVLALAVSPYLASADTLKQGTICDETWTAAASPYRLVDNCTVPAGCTLTIQPGVEVKIDEGYSLNVLGQLLADGMSPSGRITFRCSEVGRHWNQIWIDKTDGQGSRLTFCDLRDATNAIAFRTGWGAVCMTEITGCTFSNCAAYCIQASTDGAQLNLRVTASRFSASANGFTMWAASGPSAGSDVIIANSIFEQIAGSAVEFIPHSSMPTLSPRLFNNLFRECTLAVDIYDPYDCALFNNIIENSSLAIRTSGALSRQVGYNCLFNNQTNFVGYPSAYGRFDDVNGNGTPADAFMNITNNPLFCELTNYTLLATSPCIDAGNPAGAYLDNYLATNACQPGSSLGTITNDIGVHGGPNACGWRVPPWNPTNFTLAAERYFGAILNPGVPGHYRIEWSPSVDGGTWTQATNLWLTGFPYIYIDYDTPNVGMRFYRALLLP
jgi:hypothetical protein